MELSGRAKSNTTGLLIEIGHCEDIRGRQTIFEPKSPKGKLLVPQSQAYFY